ncbi:MAG: hypothetical protein M0D57_11645 [Sphingobacteriales bacterium JAD_PAG50586_3]|nr:MAG: hypothetical protein M0D57_11645 [Sphingobacteriales bacterium JAD_PAG50586_3]
MQISRGSITQAGTGVVTYNTTASTLLYNSTTAAQTVTAVEFPSTNSPTNLTINNTLGLSLPASFVRSLTGTLTMTAGNFNLAANTFSLGTSASVPGTLNYTAGLIVNGTFTRWFSTTGINTAQQTDPEFPMGVGVSGRKLWMWRSGTFTTGGSISVAFNNTSGLTSITPFIDGTLSVDKRTNQFWGITTSGWAGSGTISMEAFWEDAPFTISSASQLRLIQASSAVGSVGSNTGFTPDWEIQRTGLTTTNLNNNFYVGTAAANMISDIQSVADGSWLTPATWNCACVPVQAIMLLLITPTILHLQQRVP